MRGTSELPCLQERLFPGQDRRLELARGQGRGRRQERLEKREEGLERRVACVGGAINSGECEAAAAANARLISSI